MEKKQFENERYVIYAPDKLKYIIDEMAVRLDERLEIYKSLFAVADFRKIEIIYFDDVAAFRGYIYSLRGEKESLPDWARGVFDEGKIIFCEDDFPLPDTPLYFKKIYNAIHELFHIMYKELVLIPRGLERVIWFDEGMAQLFSKEREFEYIESGFATWFRERFNRETKYSNLNTWDWNMFRDEATSIYDLSFLAVKYLYETMAQDDFRSLMSDIDCIKEFGDTVLPRAIEFYERSFHI